MLRFRFFIFVFFSFFFCSCCESVNEISSLPHKFEWRDFSFIDGVILSMRDDMSFEDGKIKACEVSGTGSGAYSNLAISNLGGKAVIGGIDIDVFANINCEAVGLEVFKNEMGAKKSYRFFFRKSGKFEIWFVDRDVGSYKCLKSYSDTVTNYKSNHFNNIRIKTLYDGDVELYTNGRKIWSIAKNDIQTPLEHYFIGYMEISGFKYSTDNPLLAYWKLNSLQIEK